MKIFDCFMYFDEDAVLDVRLNYLTKYVDKFIIIESRYNHKGEKREPQFDFEKFQKFKEKINYILIDKEPAGIEEVYESDNHDEKSRKFILNAITAKYKCRIFNVSVSPILFIINRSPIIINIVSIFLL